MGYSTHYENKDKWKFLYQKGTPHTVSNEKFFTKKPSFSTLANDVEVADNTEKTVTFKSKDGKEWIQIDQEGKYANGNKQTQNSGGKMFSWTAKIHKSGSKVRIYDGDRFVKEVVASADTFAPAEAKDFATELLAELTAQSKKADSDISVHTPAEVQDEGLDLVKSEAKGLDPKDATKKKAQVELPTEDVVEAEEDVEGEEVVEEADGDTDEVLGLEASKKIAKLQSIIGSYKTALKQEKTDRVIERKARRGLAIAKQMVANGELKNDYEIIRTKVAEIVDMESREIEMLERKVAGEREFASVDEAKREARRQRRIARINRVAAEEAEEENDEEEADVLDAKAEEAEGKAASYEKIAQEMVEELPVEEADVDPEVPEVVEEAEADKKEEVIPVEAKKKVEAKKTVKAEEEKDEDEDEEEKEAKLSATYRRIAAKHRKLAEEAEAQGNTEVADTQDELADQADDKAEKLEEEAQADLAGEVTEMQEAVEEVVEEAEADKVDLEEEVVEEKQLGGEEMGGVDSMTAAGKKAPKKTAEKEEDEDEKEEDKEEEVVEASKKVKASALKRDGVEVDSFGIDKNASLIEQNTYTGDREVESLSSMWKGAPQE